MMICNDRFHRKLRYFAAAVLAAVLCLQVGCGKAAPYEQLKKLAPALTASKNTVTSSYPLLEGTELENSVTVLQGETEGAVLYIVAGLHGDEVAGWMAGDLLKHLQLKSGTVYILSPANLYGAEHGERYTRSTRDANRWFPGDADGWDAQRIDDAIYRDIQQKQPDLVLDLHEAHQDSRTGGERFDNLGNSLICESLEGCGELVLDLILDSEKGEIANFPFTLYGSPPKGSLNRTVTQQLHIPVITVETWRGDEQETRISNHLNVAAYCMEWLGML